MPFIPHTEADIASMLASIGAPTIDALFEEIPAVLRSGKLAEVPDGMNEMQVTRLMGERAALDTPLLNFIGAGSYEHHIPAAVWQIATRGEFYTAYTPYQAEASQGTLQVLYEYQTMMTSLTSGAYSTTGKIDAFTTETLRRIESIPGVEAAATTVVLPAVGYGIDLPFNIAGKPPAKGGQYNGDEQYRYVAGHYFQAFRIPLMRGRRFTETDTGNSTPVVIINQNMAKHYWPNQDPIGQVITIGQGLGPQFADPPRQIVGVVGTVKETGVANGDAAVMYIPAAQVPQGMMDLARQLLPLAWVVRGRGDLMALRAAVERQIQTVDATMTVSHVEPMEKVLASTVARQNFNMLLLSIFAAIALLLAAIGIYGVMSYSVEQRTQEIGIRMALGSSRADVLKLMLSQGLKLAGIGVAIGLTLAYLLTRFLASLLFSVKAGDPWTLAAVAAILALAALIATYIPARRAAATDPGQALHCQ